MQFPRTCQLEVKTLKRVNKFIQNAYKHIDEIKNGETRKMCV